MDKSHHLSKFELASREIEVMRNKLKAAEEYQKKWEKQLVGNPLKKKTLPGKKQITKENEKTAEKEPVQDSPPLEVLNTSSESSADGHEEEAGPSVEKSPRGPANDSNDSSGSVGQDIEQFLESDEGEIHESSENELAEVEAQYEFNDATTSGLSDEFANLMTKMHLEATMFVYIMRNPFAEYSKLVVYAFPCKYFPGEWSNLWDNQGE
jgi:hypothetical protein